MNPQDSRRIARAIQVAALPASDRMRIASEAAQCNTFEELPAWIRDLVRAAEATFHRRAKGRPVLTLLLKRAAWRGEEVRGDNGSPRR